MCAETKHPDIDSIFTTDFIEVLTLVSRMDAQQLERFMAYARPLLQNGHSSATTRSSPVPAGYSVQASTIRSAPPDSVSQPL